MLQYVNGFSFAVDDKKEEYIINFYQSVPQVNKDGEVSEVTKEDVSSLVMKKTTAENLLNFLKTMLEKND